MVVSCYEHKRKSKSNIVCLCGLQWLCLLSVGHLKVHVSSGRTSLRTAATETKRKSKSNIVCLCGLQWLRLWSVGDLRVNVSSGRMSLRTAARKTRENVKAILYVFADCKHEANREDAKSIRMRKMKRSGVVHRGVWQRKLGFWLYVIWYACNRNSCAAVFPAQVFCATMCRFESKGGFWCMFWIR